MTNLADSSASSSVLKRPKLNLMEASAAAVLSPIARSTCEGSVIPLAQAAPTDAAKRG